MKYYKLNVTLFFGLTMILTSISCTEKAETNTVNSTFIDLSDGFYFLNGTDLKYKVKRNTQTGGNYILNPETIFNSDDYDSIQVVKEDNGKYSLSFDLNIEGTEKWNDVLKSEVHFIGFINENKLDHLLKIKGDNSSHDLYLKCISNSKVEVNSIKENLLL